MEQEARRRQALSTAEAVRIGGARMELRTADGALAANFARAK